MGKKLCLSFFIFSALILTAALPPDTVVIEAESLISASKAWESRPHFGGWYDGCPSGKHLLSGWKRKMGSAEGAMTVLRPGKHRLWVRYLDMVAHHRKECGFIVTVKQNGKELFRKEFDRENESLRKTAAGRKKWGSGFARFVWDSMEMDFPAAGTYQLQVDKLHDRMQISVGGRHLDLFLLTPDLSYQPNILDLNPWYFRIRILPEQKTPIAIHLFGRRSLSHPTLFISHRNYNRKGCFLGADNGAGNMKTAFYQAGDASAWICLNDVLSFYRTDRLEFSAMTSYFVPEPDESFYELQFSSTPSEKGLRGTFRRQGKGSRLMININTYLNTVSSEVEESRKDLERAMEAIPKQLKRPRLYPFATGLDVDYRKNIPATVSNELSVMERLGINVLPPNCAGDDNRFPWFHGSNFFYYLAKYEPQAGEKCLGQPLCKDIRRFMKNYISKVKKAGTPERLKTVILTDEAGFKAEHITKCPYCRSHFQDYLKSQNVSLAGLPTLDPKDGLRYYWSMRYRNHIHTEMMRSGSKALQEALPGAASTVNFAIELLYDGNMVHRGCDWFEILGSDALAMGWGEDWANFSSSYQVNSFYDSVLRAACRPRRKQFGIYDILADRSAWEIQAKAYIHMGQGASIMHFFNYGPHYTLSSDFNNRRPEIYRAISRITGTTAAIEDALVKSVPAQGDAAQLLSVTSDIWNDKRGNYFGKERVYFNLLLSHCNYRIDILSEQELASTLRNYRILFVNDSHLLQQQVKPLLDWVAGGGTLVMTAGALERNEADQPLGFDQAAGLKRQPVKLVKEPGRPQYDLPYRKSLGEYQKMNLFCGYQEPYCQNLQFKKGKIISLGFFPGLGYLRESTHNKKDSYSVRSYPAAYRSFIAQLNLPAQPKLKTDNPLVQSMLMESPEDRLLVFSNWTGQPQTVNATLNTDRKFSKLIPAGIEILNRKSSRGKLQLQLKIQEGGFIRCRL